jgi:hypothetical protein
MAQTRKSEFWSGIELFDVGLRKSLEDEGLKLLFSTFQRLSLPHHQE